MEQTKGEDRTVEGGVWNAAKSRQTGVVRDEKSGKKQTEISRDRVELSSQIT